MLPAVNRSTIQLSKVVTACSIQLELQSVQETMAALLGLRGQVIFMQLLTEQKMMSLTRKSILA